MNIREDNNLETKRLPDTPWHVGFAKKKEEDPRRHKARCIHIDSLGICKCMKAGAYTCKCGGSAHCTYYAETWEQWEEVKVNTQTTEEVATERIERYKKTLKERRESIRNNSEHTIHYTNLSKIVKCVICDEKIVPKGTAMYCKFCGTYYVNPGQVDAYKIANHISDNEIIVVGKTRENLAQIKSANYSLSCIHSGKRNKCKLVTAERYGKSCKKENCSGYITRLKP